MPTTPPPEPPQTFDLTLEEFCLRVSTDDRRVEMLSAFFADERANQRFKDSESAFRDRYAAFQTRPA